MIRVIQRRLIIPRGDTGIFTIPAMTQAEGAIGVFTIFDPITNTRIFQKQVEIEGENFNISFSHADTVNLKAGDYLWDIKFYKNPILADNKVIDGEEINSYYAAFQAPKCEIRETGDDFLMIEGQPAKIEDLNIILGATEAANAAKVAATEQAGIAAAKAEEAAAKLEEMMVAMPTKVSELENDSGYLQEETDPTVPAWAKAQTKPSYTPQEVGALPADTVIPTVPTNVSAFTNDAGYLTAHQDISMKANSADLAAVATSGSYNDLSDKPIIPEVPVQDVQIAGTSILTNGIANIPNATSGISGTVMMATNANINNSTGGGVIIGAQAKRAAFYGLALAAGDTTQKESSNSLGTYTDGAKIAIQTMLDVPSNAAMNTAIGNAIGNINSFDIAVVQELPTQDISTHTIYLVPKTGETNDVYDEYVYINNAWEMVGNTQIDLSNYVQKTDYASDSNYGVVKVSSDYGIKMSNGFLMTQEPTSAMIKGGVSPCVITPVKQHQSVFYGLAKAAGDTTQSQSSNAIGTYTTEAKAAIQTMLDVPAKADIPEVPVQDVQVAGTSVIGNDGVANIPAASLGGNYGIVKLRTSAASSGLTVGTDGTLVVAEAQPQNYHVGTSSNPMTVYRMNYAAFYGLARAAGVSSNINATNGYNSVGQYTDEAKVAIQNMLGITDALTTKLDATDAGLKVVRLI